MWEDPKEYGDLVKKVQEKPLAEVQAELKENSQSVEGTEKELKERWLRYEWAMLRTTRTPDAEGMVTSPPKGPVTKKRKAPLITPSTSAAPSVSGVSTADPNLQTRLLLALQQVHELTSALGISHPGSTVKPEDGEQPQLHELHDTLFTEFREDEEEDRASGREEPLRLLRFDSRTIKALDHWRIAFSGAPHEDADAFLKKLDRCMSSVGLSWGQVLPELPIYLTGVAGDWLDGVTAEISTWRKFCREFSRQFSAPVDDNERLENLRLIRQGNNETISVFSVRLRKEAAKLQTPLTEQALLGFLFRALLPAYRNKLLWGTHSTVEALIEAGRMLEKQFRWDKADAPVDNDQRRGGNAVAGKTRGVASVQPEESSEPARDKKVKKSVKKKPKIEKPVLKEEVVTQAVDALQEPLATQLMRKLDVLIEGQRGRTILNGPPLPVNGRQDASTSRPTVCFQCGKEGHFVAACPERRVLKCFTCGREGHTSKYCRQVPSGNEKAGR